MSRADRVARQRADARARQEQADAATIRREAEDADDRTRHAIHVLTRDVLARLDALDYPDAEVLRLSKAGVFGRRSKAAWRIGTYEESSRGDTVTGILYLLSDGRIATSGGASFGTHVFDLESRGPFYVTKLGIIKDGLEALARRLG